MSHLCIRCLCVFYGHNQRTAPYFTTRERYSGPFLIRFYKQSDFNMSEVLSTLFQAGIKDVQLEFALEPEAAAVYVKETKVTKQRVSVDQHDLVPFPPSTQFMVLDLGGGL